MFLGIDLGTSAVKAVVVDSRQRLVARSSVALTCQRPQPLWSEQDPEQWWQATVAAVRSLPSATRRAVHSIGLSGQMHGAVLLDRHQRVQRPAILWNDGRSERECREIQASEPRLQNITGNLAMPGFTAPKLLWLRRHEPEIFAHIAMVLLPKDYLRLRLTGNLISDLSDASGTLWLNVAERAWSEPMLAASHLTRSQVPELVEGNSPTGRVRADVSALLGIETALVAGGAGDNAATAVGTGVVEPGDAFLSLGTSGVLFVVTDQFQPSPQKAAHAFCHALPARWHQMSVMLSAASALDWATNLLGFQNIAAAMAAAQAQGLNSNTPLFLPYLNGERTPHNDPFARGVFYRLSPDTSAADLIVSVLEGVAHGFVDGLDTLTQAGSTVSRITLVGGGTRADYWSELLAAALNLPLIRSYGAEHAAALGAARLGRLALSAEDPATVCLPPEPERLFTPDEGLAQCIRARHSSYANLYRQLKDTFTEFST
jgi:xylulokinase